MSGEGIIASSAAHFSSAVTDEVRRDEAAAIVDHCRAQLGLSGFADEADPKLILRRIDAMLDGITAGLHR